MSKRIWIILLAGLVSSVYAFGANSIEALVDTGVGSYTYAGGPAPLIGSGIGITDLNVDVTGGPENGNWLVNGPLPSSAGAGPANSAGTDGDLEFTTGAATGLWSWGAGTFSIVGCIPGVTAAVCTSSTNTTLVSDDYTSAAIVPSGPGVGIEFGGITGTINPAVAAYFGVNPIFTSGATLMYLAGLTEIYGTPFTSGVTSGTSGSLELNTTTAVPEGWSLFTTLGIFAFGVVAFCGARRLGLIKAVAV